MSKTWVLVAERSRAKIFEQDHPRSQLHEIHDFDHAASRLNDRDLVSSNLTRTYDPNGVGHSVEPDTDPKLNEAHIFARELATHLDHHCGKQFNKLVVIAPPEFLGILRDTFSDHISKIVAASVNKNLVHETAESIQGHLPFSF